MLHGELDGLDTRVEKTQKGIEIIRRKGPPGQKDFRGLVKSLNLRAEGLCSADCLPLERAHLRHVLSCNGFSRHECDPPRTSEVERELFVRPRTLIPYVPGVGEKIRRLLSGFDIPIAFRPRQTLRSVLCEEASFSSPGSWFRVPVVMLGPPL